MKYVLTYTRADPPDPEGIRANIDAHRALWAIFREQGTLLLIGPFADASGGAMAVFTSNEAAEAFAAADPFVANGVVGSWSITPWNEVLLDPI